MIIDYGYDSNIVLLLTQDKKNNVKNGFYHFTQVQFAYCSNHIEGSTLTPEQTELIYDKGEISGKAKVNDVLEAANHFRMFDYLLDSINQPLDAELIKNLHYILRNGIDNDAGQYKKQQNQIGVINPVATTNVNDVPNAVDTLLSEYNKLEKVSFEDILSFHCAFEKIHPFQDGNGRTGRAIMFRECIRNSIMPFIVYELYRPFYISGLTEWRKGNRQQLLETMNACQEVFCQNYQYFIGQQNSLMTPEQNQRQFNNDTAVRKNDKNIEERS